MLIVKEINLRKFILHDCSPLAMQFVKYLTYHEVCVLADCIEDMYAGTTPSERDLNEFLWLESDTWVTWLGFEDTDELLDREEE